MQAMQTSSTNVNTTTTKPNNKILFNKYKLLHLLGHGSSAKVYLACHLPSNQNVAIKVFPKLTDPSIAVIREISALRRLRHKHILRLLEVLASKSKVYLVLELASGGELFSHLEANGKLDENTARLLFRQLISAVSFSHSKGVFHRDLKPENLLLDASGDLKVSDFGLAALDDANRSNRADGLLRTFCGTPAYVAPEILGRNGYDGACVDVWACGVILFVLTAGYLPFNDYNMVSMYRKIYNGRFRCPEWMSTGLRSLLSRILDPNPETRATIDGIVRDPWFNEGFDEVKWGEMVRPSRGEVGSGIRGGDDGRKELNAFDLISFSSGLDLSGLINGRADQERFIVNEPVERVLDRVQELGRKEGLVTGRIGKKGLRIVLEGQNGDFVSCVAVFKLTDEVALVEVVEEGDFDDRKIWREKLRCDFRVPLDCSVLA